MPRLFVSYARLDLPIVGSLVAELRELGYDPFFDQELTGGQQWWDVLLDRIRDSDGFLPVLSENYCESEACRLEAEWADKLHVPLLPIDLGQVSPDLCDPHISRANWVRYTLDDRASLARLSRALNALPPRELPSPLPERPSIPITYLALTRQEIRDSPVLGVERQLVIISTLRAKLGTDADASTRTLLTELRRRSDITYANALEIDSLLKSRNRPPRKAVTPTPPVDGPAKQPRTASPARGRVVTQRMKVIAAVGFAIVLVAAATGIWLGFHHDSHSPAAQAGAKQTSSKLAGTTPAGSPSMPMSPSMKPSDSMSDSPRAGSLAAALSDANMSDNARGLVPPEKCHALSDTEVTCDHPYPGVATAKFEVLASLNKLYDAYEARVEMISGAPIRQNKDDCSLHSSSGEFSWNHNHQHSTSFSIAQLRSGHLNEDTQAAGRAFCQTSGGALTMVWTDKAGGMDSGGMLAEVDGDSSHEDTYIWWVRIHHAIALNGMTMDMGHS